MTDHELTAGEQHPGAPVNGVHAANGAGAHAPGEEVKEKKTTKKQQKKAEKKQRKFLERFPPVPHQFDSRAPAQLEQAAPAPQGSPAGRVQGWLRPTSRNLSNDQAAAASKSSALIAINCLMLSLAAHSVFSQRDAGQLWWALIPLALTNVLSLLFAVLSAKVQQSTTLDELCAMPQDEYEPALAALTQDKEHLHAALLSELYLLGRDLGRRQKHLRTAYNVLLGGIPLSAMMFGICVALSRS